MSDSDHSKPFFTYSETRPISVEDDLRYCAETMDRYERLFAEACWRVDYGFVPTQLKSFGEYSEDCGKVVTFECANPLPEPKPMETKVIKNSRGTSEITISVGYSSESMLVPEARRFMAQLSEAIKQAERDNKPAPKHPWE